MTRINYDNRRFTPQNNTANGEVNSSTVFHYHQQETVVWATYAGGSVRFGTLIANVLDDDSLDMRYSHVNANGDLMTGKCRSIPELLSDGRLRLHETWTWTSGDNSSGSSIVEEVKS